MTIIGEAWAGMWLLQSFFELILLLTPSFILLTVGETLLTSRRSPEDGTMLLSGGSSLISRTLMSPQWKEKELSPSPFTSTEVEPIAVQFLSSQSKLQGLT